MKVVFDLREVLFQRRGWQRYGVNLLKNLIQFDDVECSFIENKIKAEAAFPFLFSKTVRVVTMKINPFARKGLPSNDFIESHDIYHSLTDYPEFIPRRARLIATIHDISSQLFSHCHSPRFVKLMANNLKTIA